MIINASEETGAVFALEKETGNETWKAEGAALSYVFGTPVLATHAERTSVLLSLPGEVWALNPDSGKLRWYAETGLSGNIAPSVVVGDGIAFAFGGYPRLGAVAIRLGGSGDVTDTHVFWNTHNSTYIPTPVLHDGHLYFASDNGFAVCLDATSGDLLYKERLPGASASGRGGKPFYASAVMADENIYAVSRRNGVFVFAARPEFELIAHNRIEGDSSDFNATPAISEGQLFLRSNEFVYCIELLPSTNSQNTR